MENVNERVRYDRDPECESSDAGRGQEINRVPEENRALVEGLEQSL